MPEGWKTITIKEEVFDKLTKKYDGSKTSQKISPWISDLVLMNLEKDELLHKYAPFLEVIGEPNSGDTLYIKNHKENKIVEIKMNKNYKLECSDDDPIYLQFAWALPELVNLQRKN